MSRVALRGLLLIVFLALASSLFVANSFGQAVSIAQVGGAVTDPGGASVAGAQVTMTQTATGQSHRTKSDDQGRFTFPNLPVGEYRLEVRAPGFKSYLQQGITLQVGNSIAIKVPLQLGAVTESVTVEASAGMVETRDNSVSQVIDTKRIEELPLNGRQPTQLILLSGAAVNSPSNSMTGSKNYFSSTTISVAGGQLNGVNYLLDGGDHNDSFTNVNLPIPFPDALQEFSVQTSSLPARYGLHPGAIVNAVTKSGSNQLHGSVFEFLRNGNINAKNYFATKHDTLKRNQFGGTLGGKFISDKLFFFGGFQGTRNRSDPVASITSFVPTAAVLAGDFKTITSKTLIDPQTGKAFPNNQIPTTRFNQQSLNLLKYIPISSDPKGKLVYGIPTTGDEEQVIGRIDFLHTIKHSLYGRYFYANYRNPAVFDGNNLLTTTQAGNLERAQSLVIGDTYTFSSTLVNSFHATATRRRDDRGPASNVINPADLGIKVSTPTKNLIQGTINSYFSVGCGTCAPAHFNVNSFQFADDVDLIRGKHQLAFGVDYIRDQMNVVNDFNRNGVFTFNGSVTGDALADFMLGLDSLFNQTNPLINYTRATVLAFYGQDTIRLTPRLTINAGLRWEPTLPAYDEFGHGTTFSFADFAAGKKSQVYLNAPVGLLTYGDPGIPKGYSHNVWSNLAPRVGIVFDPTGSGRETIRASAAVLRDTAEVFYNERLTTNAPFASSTDINNPPGGLTDPYQGFPGGNPFPGNSVLGPNVPFPLSGGVYVNMPIEIHPTYTTQWNLSYQRQLTRDWLMSLTYLGNKTTHIWVGEEINPAVFIPGNCGATPCSTTGNTNKRRLTSLQNPVAGAAYGSIVQSEQGGNGSYHGVLASLQHRFANHFTVLSNYTWSHCISDVDFAGELAGSAYQNPADRRSNRGNCNFDVRHVFNTSIVAQSPGIGEGWAGLITKGWQLAPILSVRSGLPLTVTTGTDNSLTGVGQDRPNQVLPNVYANNRSADQWLNPAAFSPNTTGTYGNSGRNTVRAPGVLSFDLSLSRTFRLTERWQLEARADAFNAINHTNLGNPVTAKNASNFGKITTTALNPQGSGGPGDPRILQFAAKIRF